MAKLNPYLTFTGNCREVMEFYKACIGGELELMVISDSPMAAQIPAEKQKNILHSVLKSGNIVLMASDILDSSTINIGNAVTLCLSGGTKEEIEGYFDKLSQGAHVTHPFKEEFFGMYGDLTDKFGIRWMFQAEMQKK